ncbi:MAG: hypothetical protein AB7L71_15565 [Vicinamibacterales bacterium]
MSNTNWRAIVHVCGAAALALAVSVLPSASSGTAQGEGASVVERRNKVRLQKERIFQKDLRSAAAVSGTVVQRVPVPGGFVEDLASLVARSSEIVVGRLGPGRGRYVAGTPYVTSDYDLVVETTLKGDARVGDNLTVVLLGGRAYFDDGTWAQTMLENFRAPIPGERILLFAKPTPLQISADVRQRARAANSVPLAPVSYLSGLIRLSESGRIDPGLYDGIAKEFVGQDVSDVLDVVMEQVKRLRGKRSR